MLGQWNWFTFQILSSQLCQYVNRYIEQYTWFAINITNFVLRTEHLKDQKYRHAYRK